MNDPKGLYRQLGVARDATPEQIKKAYRRLASRHHPDRKNGNTEIMKSLIAAYSVLSDPERRAEYDRSGNTDTTSALEQGAANMLCDFFSQYLDKGGDNDNPIAIIRESIGVAIKETLDGIRKLEKQLAKLEKRSTVVKRKQPGADLYGMVLQSKMTDLKLKIGNGRQRIAVAERCQLLTDEYECSVIEVPQSAQLRAQHEWENLFRERE